MPSEDRVAEIEKTFAEENNPLNIHFNATKDNRAMGAGFYQFSADEETRRAQMDELRTAREETLQARQETGAVDVKAGEVEGMQTNEIARSRAVEKRKREIEERRALIEAKRKKVKAEETEEPRPPSVAQPVMQPASQTARDVSVDPFVALEGHTAPSKKEKAKKSKSQPTEADTFLAQLEKDLLDSRRK